MIQSDFVNGITKRSRRNGQVFTDRLMGYMLKTFSQNAKHGQMVRPTLEDCAQRAVLIASREVQVQRFVNMRQAYKFIYQTSRRLYIDSKKTLHARTVAAKRSGIGVTMAKTYDPFRRLDWKIDLERGIAAVTTDTRMRQALWHMIYEGYTVEDVMDM